MATAGLEITPSVLDLLSQLGPPVLNEPPAHDLDELGLIRDGQFVDSIQELCETHTSILPQRAWTVQPARFPFDQNLSRARASASTFSLVGSSAFSSTRA